MKNRWIQLSGALTLALAVSACAGDSDNAANNNSAPASSGGAAVGTAGSGGNNAAANANNARADQEFVQEQLAMGEAEIALGQLAQQRGQHAEVKRFGEMMVRDHRAAGQELKEIMSNVNAGQSGTAAGTESARNTDAHKDHQEALEELRKLSGREFDREYISRMVKDHEEAVSDAEKKAENASNPQVRQWAAKTLPKMQQHLERAKTIQETLEQAGNRK